jgi:arylsulfatase A-like enzyme
MPSMLRVRILLLVLSLFPGFRASAATPSPRRPNVVFLFTDDQRADTIHALGNRHVRTPNIDRLVQEGVAFREAHIPGSPKHGAVCQPSRAMLMSGRSIFRVREDLKDTPTWPEQLRKAGYRTYMAGKWHNGEASATRVFPEAGAVFLGGMTDPFAVGVVDIEGGKAVRRRKEGRFAAEVFADAALGFLRRQSAAEPFCLYVAFTTPHDPRTAPEEFRRRQDPARLPLPSNFLPRHPFDNGELEVRDEKLLPWPRTPEAVRGEIADYHASIEATDFQIGRVLTELDRLGLAEKTVVVFAADNGLALGSHGLLGKQNLYEHSLRVPLVVRGPGIARNRRSDALCYLSDLAPTLCRLAGTEPPEGHEGVDLVPILRGEPDAKGRDQLFGAYRELQRSVRDARWKRIEYPKIGRVQLFDLKNDPDELRDLAAVPAHAATLRRLERALQEQRKALGDPMVAGGARSP